MKKMKTMYFPENSRLNDGCRMAWMILTSLESYPCLVSSLISLFSIISLVVSGLDTKKKLFSSFVDKPADTKHARVDKFEAIKGRLLKEKYSPGRGAI